MTPIKYPADLVARVKGAIKANVSHKRIAQATGLSVDAVGNLAFARKDVEPNMEIQAIIERWLAG